MAGRRIGFGVSDKRNFTQRRKEKTLVHFVYFAPLCEKLFAYGLLLTSNTRIKFPPRIFRISVSE